MVVTYATIAVTPNSRNIMALSTDGTFKVYDLETAKERLSFDDPNINKIPVFTGTPEVRHVLLESKDGSIAIWDIQKVREVCNIKCNINDLEDIITQAITPDSRSAIFGLVNGELRIYDLKTRSKVRTITGHKSRINAVSITKNGRYAVSGSDDNTVKIWDLHVQVEKYVQWNTMIM